MASDNFYWVLWLAGGGELAWFTGTYQGQIVCKGWWQRLAPNPGLQDPEAHTWPVLNSLYQGQNQMACFQAIRLCPKRKDAMITLSWKWAWEGLFLSHMPIPCHLEINETNKKGGYVINGY